MEKNKLMLVLFIVSCGIDFKKGACDGAANIVFKIFFKFILGSFRFIFIIFFLCNQFRT
jgi:hypothetical protein